VNTYTSIYDCPAWNFTKAAEDPRYLLKLDSYKSLPEVPDTTDLQALYGELYFEFLNEFGVGSTESAILGMERDILELELSGLIEANATLQSRINLIRKRITELQTTGSDATIWDIAAGLSKFAGYDISPLRLTVVEFYSKLKQYEKAVEKSSSNRDQRS
jgi:hypothetical protein